MTPVVWAIVGFVAGLIVMWLIMRFTVLKSSQQQAQSLNARIAEEESARAKDREEIGKLESRLAVPGERQRRSEGPLEQDRGPTARAAAAVAALEAQVAGLESARSDLERAMTRMEDRVARRATLACASWRPAR